MTAKPKIDVNPEQPRTTAVTLLAAVVGQGDTPLSDVVAMAQAFATLALVDELRRYNDVALSPRTGLPGPKGLWK